MGLLGDRVHRISSRQRSRMDARETQTSAAAEWEHTFLKDASNKSRKDAACGSLPMAGASRGSDPDFHSQAIQAQMRSLLPRSKRKEVTHSGLGRWDQRELEDDTDSSDDESESPEDF